MKREVLIATRTLMIAVICALVLGGAGCIGRDKRLVGQWELAGEGKIMGLYLAADGNARAVARLYEEAPPAIIKLRWKAKGESLVLWMEGTDFRLDYQYQLSAADELTLRQPGQPEVRYKRAQ